MANKKSLKATVGATAAGILMTMVPQFEGMVLRGYKDPIGIVTACAGHTKTAILGKPYSKSECLVLLESDLAEHAAGVLQCVPVLEGKTYEKAAAISLAFNIGTGRFCSSTAAKKFNAGDMRGGCDAIALFRKAGGKVMPGLVNRRTVERDLCLMGVQ